MQEVDEKFFKNDLSVVLGQHGFTGQLKVKAGDAPEGSAIFYRTTKFKYVATTICCCFVGLVYIFNKFLLQNSFLQLLGLLIIHRQTHR